MTEVISIISIFCGKILLVKKGDFWILPGGKIREKESHEKCILRELSQELPGSTLIGDLRYFGKFSGISPISRKPITVKCYLGNIRGDISPAMEISDATWTIKESVFSYNLSEITKNIIKKISARKIL